MTLFSGDAPFFELHLGDDPSLGAFISFEPRKVKSTSWSSPLLRTSAPLSKTEALFERADVLARSFEPLDDPE